MTQTKTTPETIVEEITIDAPADRVFDAFTQPAERVIWWNIEGRFHTRQMESDLRPGGAWVMRGTRADGGPFTITGQYRVVDRPRLIVFTWRPDWQGDETVSEVRVEFTDVSGATHVRLTHSGLTTDRSRQSHRGWPQILALLKAHLGR